MFKSHAANTCTPPRRINKSLNEVSVRLEFPRREKDNERGLLSVFLSDFWTLIQEPLLRVCTHF